jgi:hypothetical protein
MTSPRKRAYAVVCAGAVAAALAAVPAANGAATSRAVEGLNGPRGLDIGHGRMVVADSDGVISQVDRSDGSTDKIGKVAKGFGAAVAVAGNGDVWALTGGGHGTLYLWKGDHKRRAVLDVGAWQKKHNPDPYDLEDKPGESNAYGLEAVKGGVLVADAANNSVIHVTTGGKATHIARVKPRVVEMPEGFDDPELPPAGTPMPSESVVTSVAQGKDGAIYLSELRGFPATPGTSSVWRVEPGAHGAVCKPNKPSKGACTQVVDGLTSVVALAIGGNGALYAAELSKMGWLAAEMQVEGSSEGAIIKISKNRERMRELSPGKVHLPGGVAVGGNGNVFTSGPVFGPGGVMKVG